MARSVPREIRRAVAREHGERVLAAQRDTAGRWQVGTAAALHLDPGDDAETVRIPWEHVESLSWDADASTITVLHQRDGEVRRRVVSVDEGGRLVELARERVDASILTQAREQVGDGRSAVTVVARRSPTRSGPVTFTYLLDPGLSSDDPGVREATAQALAEVRADLGLDNPEGTSDG